jgi:hypothetical protein
MKQCAVCIFVQTNLNACHVDHAYSVAIIRVVGLSDEIHVLMCMDHARVCRQYLMSTHKSDAAHGEAALHFYKVKKILLLTVLHAHDGDAVSAIEHFAIFSLSEIEVLILFSIRL